MVHALLPPPLGLMQHERIVYAMAAVVEVKSWTLTISICGMLYEFQIRVKLAPVPAAAVRKGEKDKRSGAVGIGAAGIGTRRHRADSGRCDGTLFAGWLGIDAPHGAAERASQAAEPFAWQGSGEPSRLPPSMSRAGSGMWGTSPNWSASRPVCDGGVCGSALAGSRGRDDLGADRIAAAGLAGRKPLRILRGPAG
jgi:hypothetical protein